jgi:type IV pilus assembly protein PilM
MADESIWKKEISFGRKRKDGEDADEQRADEPTSIWKKEISFGRKKDAAPEPAAEEPTAEEPAADEEPAWTRAVSFGRKAEPDAPVEEPAVEEPVVEEATWTRAVSFGRQAEPDPLADETGHVEGTVPETSPQEPAPEEPAWTGVVSFPRQGEPEPVPDVPETGAQEPPAEEATWTRAVSFGRKVEPESVADDSGHVEGTVPETSPEEPPVSEPVAAEPAGDADESGHVAGTVPETGPEEPQVAEATWTRAVSFGRTPEPEPVAAEPAGLDEPVVSAEPVAAVPEPLVASVPEPVAPEAPPLTSTVQPEPVAPPAAPQTPVIAEQVAPPEDDSPEQQKVPFWKKEIGGKKKGKTPKQKTEAVAAEATEPGKKTPFWKKEIGGKKKDKSAKQKVEAAAVVAVAAEATAPAAEKNAPFWKKELGGKKKDKPPKAERAPKQPKQKKQKKQKEPKQPKVKAARGSRGAKRITGLKIGASQLAAARVANNGSAELLQIARTPLEPGIVVGGELRDPDALAEALKEFFAKNNLPKKGVRLGIANNRIGVRTFDIAGIDDDKQLTNAIRFRAQETLPIPIDEAVLDYQVLGEGRSEDGQPTKRVLLVVAYRDLIDRYIDACRKAGIQLVGIDLEAFALLRALHAPQDDVAADADAALVAVAIGHDRSTFAVSDGRICEFTRVLEWGGSALNVAIARALDAAPSEVDGVKRALALTDEMVPEGLTPEQAQKARDAMRRAIQTFARELVSSLQYYQNQPGSLGIGEIVLTGGTAHLAGLAGELERLIGVRVRVGDPLARMKVSKKVGEAEQVGSLAVAIGLGIED